MKYILTLIMICFTTLAFADASGEIIKLEYDENKNIRVWVQYKVDGVEVPSRYPPINGKQVWCFRKSFAEFVGMTNTQIIENIKKDVEEHCNNLVVGEFRQIKNADIMDKIKGSVGTKITKDSAELFFDTDKDGNVDTKWTVYSNGSYTESPVVTP